VENRLEGLGAAKSYSYDAQNRRVFDGTLTDGAFYTFYSPDGRRIGRYKPIPAFQGGVGWYYYMAPQETKAYFAGRLIGVAGPPLPTGGLGFEAVLTDRLGSVRVRGTATMRYFPYGQEQVVTANGHDKFGTYLRDGSSGLDYADQRYYTSLAGRFMTADPYMASGDPADPQSWNRYAYVSGDPMNSYDPNGLFEQGPGTPANEPIQCSIFGIPVADPILCLLAPPIGGYPDISGQLVREGGTIVLTNGQWHNVRSASNNPLVESAYEHISSSMLSDSRCLNWIATNAFGGRGRMSVENHREW
jgi:RHS repeat-associated protein